MPGPNKDNGNSGVIRNVNNNSEKVITFNV